MRITFSALTGLMLFGCAFTAQAENIMDIFKLAVDNDPQLLAAQAEREALKENKKQAFGEFLPSLSANGGVTQNYQRHSLMAFYYDSDIPLTLASSSNPRLNIYPSMQTYLTLKQPVFDMTTIAKHKTASLEITRADLGYRIAQQDLLYRVVKHYFDVLRKTGDLNFARAEKTAIARQLKLTRARYDAGLIAVTDVHEAQARHDLAVAQEVVAENELALAEEQLREITNKSPQRLFPLKEQTPLVPPTPSNINDWVKAAKIQNLRIAQAQMSADVAKHKIAEIRAKRYPTVDLKANAGYVDIGGLDTQVYTDANVSLNVGMKLFDGNRTSSQQRQLFHKLESAQQKVEQIEREVVTQTRSAYLGVLAGMSFVKAISQAVSSSEKALKATEAGFDVGTRSAIQVLDAQRELFKNQRDYAHSRYDYILDTLQLKVAIGLLTVDDLLQVNDWLQ